MNRIGGGLLFLFGLLPFLPIDLAGILAGASNYPVSKFLVYVGIGKIIMSVTILYLTAKAFEWIGVVRTPLCRFPEKPRLCEICGI
jgi:uncharacterized membrane protein YdjX (TVP38/TMEM64 family)